MATKPPTISIIVSVEQDIFSKKKKKTDLTKIYKNQINQINQINLALRGLPRFPESNWARFETKGCNPPL